EALSAPCQVPDRCESVVAQPQAVGRQVLRLNTRRSATPEVLRRLRRKCAASFTKDAGHGEGTFSPLVLSAKIMPARSAVLIPRGAMVKPLLLCVAAIAFLASPVLTRSAPPPGQD